MIATEVLEVADSLQASEPLVSIVIPVRNEERILGRCHVLEVLQAELRVVAGHFLARVVGRGEASFRGPAVSFHLRFSVLRKAGDKRASWGLGGRRAEAEQPLLHCQDIGQLLGTRVIVVVRHLGSLVPGDTAELLVWQLAAHVRVE